VEIEENTVDNDFLIAISSGIICRQLRDLVTAGIGAGTVWTVWTVWAVAYTDFWPCGPPMYLAHTEFFNFFKDWSRDCNQYSLHSMSMSWNLAMRDSYFTSFSYCLPCITHCQDQVHLLSAVFHRSEGWRRTYEVEWLLHA